ncbi:MAG: cytochrome c family protein [Gemmataceae bacterium]|nr:cytochrome c family protein [Gemmataceae bacterium]
MWHARIILLATTAILAGIPLLRWHRVFFPLPPIAPPPGVSGVVVDDAGPCRGARVRIAGGVGGDLSDTRGQFFLSRSASTNVDAVVTAWKPGYFIAAAPVKNNPLLLRLRPMPREDHPDYRWVDPTPAAEAFSCGNCHPGVYAEWSESAHGPRRPGFQKAFHDLEQTHPERSAVCLSCHDPAPLGGKSEPLAGFSDSGIHCDFCHKVADATSETIGLTHGRFGLDLLRPNQGQMIFGPWIDSPRPENTYAPIQRSSRMCAACHEGIVFGLRVYETWSEWLASPAGARGIQCQDCHMKPTGRMTNVAPFHGGIERDPRSIANHRFFDGSQLEMLRRSLNFDVQIRGGTVLVNLEARDVGHHVPTGSPDRHLILIVTWHDSENRMLGEEHRIMAKRLRDAEGRSPVPFWQAVEIESDTRLLPHQPRQWQVAIPQGQAATVTVELIYRRNWPGASHKRDEKDGAWVVHRVVLPIESTPR